MHHHFHFLDFAPIGFFVLFTLATVLFRRFHEQSQAIPFKDNDVSKLSWGTYATPDVAEKEKAA